MLSLTAACRATRKVLVSRHLMAELIQEDVPLESDELLDSCNMMLCPIELQHKNHEL